MPILQVLSDASAVFIFWLFAQAGLHKLRPANSLYYSTLIDDYGWRNKQLSSVAIKSIALLELAVAVAIIAPPSRHHAALVAAGLLFAYMAIMGYQLYQGRRDLDCGCAGPAGGLKVSGHLLLRNIILIAMTLFCLSAGHTSAVNYWSLSLQLAIIGILVYLCCEQLLSNAQKLQSLRD